MEAVFGAEVRHQRPLPGRQTQVRIEGLQGDVIARKVGLIPGASLEGPLIEAAEYEAWVAVGLLPELGIEVLE